MEKKIEQVFDDFTEMIKNSWTYEKMTIKEKQRCIKMLNDDRTTKNVKGNYIQRWNILNAIYGAYLSGLNYNGAFWREN